MNYINTQIFAEQHELLIVGQDIMFAAANDTLINQQFIINNQKVLADLIQYIYIAICACFGYLIIFTLFLAHRLRDPEDGEEEDDVSYKELA